MHTHTCWGGEAFIRICWCVALKWLMEKTWSWKSCTGQNSFGNFFGCLPTYPLSSLHDTWPISCASHCVRCSFWGLPCCLFCQSGRWTGVGLEMPGLMGAQFSKSFICSVENLDAFGFFSDLEQMWILGCQISKSGADQQWNGMNFLWLALPLAARCCGGLPWPSGVELPPVLQGVELLSGVGWAHRSRWCLLRWEAFVYEC